MKNFEKTYAIRWADLDPNMHLRHSAYADLCASMRFEYLNEFGFPFERFAQIKIGPVIFKESTSYLKEVFPNDKVRINFKIAGLSEDGRKWQIFHEIFRESDKSMAATLEVHGAWFDLKTRKVTQPPEDLAKVMGGLPRVENFVEL